MRKLFMIAALLVAGSAYGQTPCAAGAACVSWTGPTQNTDGTAYTNRGGFRLVYGTSSTALTQTIQIADPTATSYTVTGLTPATWYFAIKAYNTAGVESALSNVASKTITATPVPLVPTPPATLTVGSAAIEVYQVIGTADAFQFLPVGTVPANTQCIRTHQVNGRYAVPTSAVTWYGNVKPKIVVALCN